MVILAEVIVVCGFVSLISDQQRAGLSPCERIVTNPRHLMARANRDSVQGGFA